MAALMRAFLPLFMAVLVLPTTYCFQASHYREALSKSILYYEAQRSGSLPPNQRVRWRGDSALEDGSDGHVDLVGGYYDAGDNVKFGFPMAFTITMLSWSFIEYRHAIARADELDNLKEAIRWGTDYFLKAHTGPTELWVQVGNPIKDHDCWQRPEDMQPPREAYLVNEKSPGTEIVAETAAAFAASSLVFRDSDPVYAKRLLRSAIQLFKFANTFHISSLAECPFYCSKSGYNDELLWAAAWLYKATGRTKYFKHVVHNKTLTMPVSEFSWENKHAGVQVLLSTVYLKVNYHGLRRYNDYAQAFLCWNLPNTSKTVINRTPGGLVFVRNGNNIQYSINAAFLASVYADHLDTGGFSCGSNLLTSKELTDFATSQVNYILGENPLRMSYMVGFGDRFPQQAHHRGASIPSIHTHPEPIVCGDGFLEWFDMDAPNPNVLTGAIVGGPDENDEFSDVRSNAAQLEPTTYNNAPFVGLVAKLAYNGYL